MTYCEQHNGDHNHKHYQQTRSPPSRLTLVLSRSSQLTRRAAGVDRDTRDIGLDVIQHATLLVHECAEVAEDLGKLMYARLDFANVLLAFLDEGLLVRELVR
jgi:hypothetical protein